jgi:hypothetical protein
MGSGARAASASAWRVVHVALFEIGRQVRQPLFGAAGALFFAFALMLMSKHGILGSAVTSRNAPPELSKAVVILSIFYLAVVVAMAGDAALRDARSGFEPILRATPVRRIEHLLGRWIGAQVAANLAFLIGLSGLVAGVFAPWTDKADVGRVRPGPDPGGGHGRGRSDRRGPDLIVLRPGGGPAFGDRSLCDGDRAVGAGVAGRQPRATAAWRDGSPPSRWSSRSA